MKTTIISYPQIQYNLQYFFLYLFCVKPINLFNPGNNTEREDFADGFSSSKYSSTISFTDLADNGWKSTLQSETNPLTKTHFSSSSNFLHFIFTSSPFKARYWHSSVNRSSLLFFMASSLWTKWVFIFATSKAKSDASSASLIFFLAHEIWVLALGLLLKRVVEGKVLGCNFWGSGVIIEEKKGTLKAIKFCRDGLSLIFEEIKRFWYWNSELDCGRERRS